MFSSMRPFLLPIGIVATLLIVGSLWFAPQLWQQPLSFLGAHEEHQSLEPVDAATLAGHPGLYYLDASHLNGTINPSSYSAYADLVDEQQMDADSVIYTDKNLPSPTPVVVPTLPAFVSSVAAGLGLTNSGTASKVSLAIVAG